MGSEQTRIRRTTTREKLETFPDKSGGDSRRASNIAQLVRGKGKKRVAKQVENSRRWRTEFGKAL